MTREDMIDEAVRRCDPGVKRFRHWRYLQDAACLANLNNGIGEIICAEFRRLAERGPTVEETIASMPICPKCGGRRECPEHMCA